MQFQPCPDQRILPPLSTGSRAAAGRLTTEHGIHDGGEIKPTKTSPAEAASSPGSTSSKRVAALVVNGTFVGVTEHLIGLTELLELLSSILALGHVRMHLHALRR